MSTTTTSGLDSGISRSASATVPASTTLSTSHMSCSIAASRTRTRVESSTRKTRIWTSLLESIVVQATSVAPIWAAGEPAGVGGGAPRGGGKREVGGPARLATRPGPPGGGPLLVHLGGPGRLGLWGPPSPDPAGGGGGRPSA